jgi:hypothetical protein
MANQAHSGIEGTPWHRCARCGTDQRTSDLVRQNGALVCSTNDCVDDTLVERRSRVIAEKLRFSQEMQPAEILRESFVDDTIDQI